MKKLLYNTRQFLSDEDIKQLEEDVYYLKIFQHVPLQKITGGRS